MLNSFCAKVSPEEWQDDVQLLIPCAIHLGSFNSELLSSCSENTDSVSVPVSPMSSSKAAIAGCKFPSLDSTWMGGAWVDGVNTGDLAPVFRIEESLKKIHTLERSDILRVFLISIVLQINLCASIYKRELSQLVNKTFTLYSLGYELCTFLHLIIIELNEIDAIKSVGVLVNCLDCDVNANFRAMSSGLPPELAVLCDCYNLLDVASCLNKSQIVESLQRMGARHSEHFIAKLELTRNAMSQKKKKNKHDCRIS